MPSFRRLSKSSRNSKNLSQTDESEVTHDIKQIRWTVAKDMERFKSGKVKEGKRKKITWYYLMDGEERTAAVLMDKSTGRRQVTDDGQVVYDETKKGNHFTYKWESYDDTQLHIIASTHTPPVDVGESFCFELVINGLRFSRLPNHDGTPLEEEETTDRTGPKSVFDIVFPCGYEQGGAPRYEVFKAQITKIPKKGLGLGLDAVHGSVNAVSSGVGKGLGLGLDAVHGSMNAVTSGVGVGVRAMNSAANISLDAMSSIPDAINPANYIPDAMNPVNMKFPDAINPANYIPDAMNPVNMVGNRSSGGTVRRGSLGFRRKSITAPPEASPGGGGGNSAMVDSAGVIGSPSGKTRKGSLGFRRKSITKSDAITAPPESPGNNAAAAAATGVSPGRRRGSLGFRRRSGRSVTSV